MMNRSLVCGLAQEYWQVKTKLMSLVRQQAVPQPPSGMGNLQDQMQQRQAMECLTESSEARILHL